MTARLVPAGVTLRAQVDGRWPDRSRASDGWIGDAAHQARPSDHNPDADGWVHAIDITADGIDADAFADQLIAYARRRAPGSERLKNVVFRDRVASGTYGGDLYWTWRPGTYGHQHHVHVSFTDAAERDGAPFHLPILYTLEDDVMALEQADVDRIAHAVWNKLYKDPTDGKDASTASLLLRARIDAHAAAGQVPTTSVGALSDADVERIARRTADVMAARLTS